MNKKVASILLKVKAVTINSSKLFTYASGIKSPIYCDNRILLSHVKERKIIVDLLIAEAKKLKFDVVAGTATAGIAWAAFVSSILGKPLIYVRSTSKSHGKGKQIEGTFNSGAKVLVVEDLISSGGSAINSVKAIRAAGGIVKDVVAIFCYNMKKSYQAFSDNNVQANVLCNIDTLLDYALVNKMINQKDHETVIKWRDSNH